MRGLPRRPSLRTVRPRRAGRGCATNACEKSSEEPAHAALEGEVVDHVRRRPGEEILRRPRVELCLRPGRSESPLVAPGGEPGGVLPAGLRALVFPPVGRFAAVPRET